MKQRRVELVYFDGCPNADRARANLEAALGAGSWQEWNLSSGDTPERFRRHGSPTVLVDGRDVTGEPEGELNAATACRADGAPSVELIRGALVISGRPL
jgi:hypothetical protein